MNEIEHKFLVSSDAYKKKSGKGKRIVQGFLNTHPERTVRVRIKGDQGFLTVKGISNERGTSRFEWEHEIPVSEAEALLRICEPGVIDKIRYEVYVEQKCFEIDEFHGDNEGLVVAEIELEEEGEAIPQPDWLGDEVTGITRYYNSMISKHPYKDWSEDERSGKR